MVAPEAARLAPGTKRPRIQHLAGRAGFTVGAALGSGLITKPQPALRPYCAVWANFANPRAHAHACRQRARVRSYARRPWRARIHRPCVRRPAPRRFRAPCTPYPPRAIRRILPMRTGLEHEGRFPADSRPRAGRIERRMNPPRPRRRSSPMESASNRAAPPTGVSARIESRIEIENVPPKMQSYQAVEASGCDLLPIWGLGPVPEEARAAAAAAYGAEAVPVLPQSGATARAEAA